MWDLQWSFLPEQAAFLVAAGEENLASWLVDKIDRPFIYIPNPGNFLGTMQLFHRLNMRFQLGSTSGKYKGELLVYGGGVTRANHEPKNNNTIILLPHSVRGFESLLESLGPNVWLWA
ncbi:hypothetical protein ACHAXR_008257 [Thalassiosira sp. AJA248-18]